MELRDKIGQLFFIGISGTELDDDTARLLDDVRPGGICLFARNIRSAEQTYDLLNGIRSVSAISPVMAVDLEGGVVDRLRRVIAPLPAASDIRNAEQARVLAELIADELLHTGFDMDFAPVVDVVVDNRKEFSNGLNTRAFGSSLHEVTEFADVFLAVFARRGLLACLKHFPGLGGLPRWIRMKSCR